MKGSLGIRIGRTPFIIGYPIHKRKPTVTALLTRRLAAIAEYAITAIR